MRSDAISMEGSLASFEARDVIGGMLLPGENIVRVAAISPGIYWKGFAMLVLSLVALVYSVVLCLYLAAVGLSMLAVAYSTKTYLMLAATDHRVIICGGIFNREVFDLRYSKIESVELMNTIPGFFFNYSNLIISGTGRLRIMVPFVQDGGAFHNDLMQKLLEREEPLPASASPPMQETVGA